MFGGKSMKLLSTLGWAPQVIVEVARVLMPEENIVFYGYVNEDERPRIENSLRKVREEVENLRVVKVDPMSFQDCIKKIQRFLDENCVVNITGGTKIMAFSLALQAAMVGIPIVYVVTTKDKMRIKTLPLLLSLKGKNFLREGSTAHRMLELLLTKYGGFAKLIDLKRDLGIKYSTLSDAKRKLMEANIIQERKEGKNKIIIANDIAYLFMEGEK